MNSQCENNGNLKHLSTKTVKSNAAHKIIADFVFRFTSFSVIPYSITQHHNITII